MSAIQADGTNAPGDVLFEGNGEDLRIRRIRRIRQIERVAGRRLRRRGHDAGRRGEHAHPGQQRHRQRSDE
ncbi:hypothetical protein [Kitasatospora sp. NPDC092286]|uniref:hypothetical protein n=1 Tax=Kitasatospora sp. NPDC092286 TaxID=3364087 RepID=UPI00380CA9EC